MAGEDEEDFTRLCPACTDTCYKSAPLWQWDEDELDSIVRQGRLHLLHSQIQHLYERSQSEAYAETRRRKSAISAFRRSAHNLWPSCQVHIYGSSATGLVLPSSDVDLLILNTGCYDSLSALETLAHHFRCSFGYRLSSLKILRNASVPIIRFHDQKTMLDFDVRCECFSSSPPELRAVQWMKNCLLSLPAMGPLYILLKMFLHENKLDTLYREGGVRPYMLFVMLYTFLLLSDDFMMLDPDESPNLSLLLLGFLQFYGNAFKSKRYGISCRRVESRHGNCFFFSKLGEVYECGYCPIVERVGFYNPLHPKLLAVEDPLNPSNDLGKISNNYPAIKDAFMQAYLVLKSRKSKLLYSFIPVTMADF